VNSQQFVLADDSADRWVIVQGAVSAMVIVNESLGLAVRPGRIGTGEALGEAVGAAGGGEEVRAIGVAVVTPDALGLDSPPAKPPQGPTQEPHHGAGPLVGQHFGIGQPVELGRS
jgi:hypothetical protein